MFFRLAIPVITAVLIIATSIIATAKAVKPYTGGIP
jgi:hypothetical protein